MLAQVFNPTEIKKNGQPQDQHTLQHAQRLRLHSSVRGAAYHQPKLRRCPRQRQRTMVAVVQGSKPRLRAQPREWPQPDVRAAIKITARPVNGSLGCGVTNGSAQPPAILRSLGD